MTEYNTFLEKKVQGGHMDGFKPTFMPSYLFDFQSDLVEWSLHKGKAAIFADCGLGKTPMQLVWGQNVVEHTNKPVLILAPLAVSYQTMREGDKFDIPVYRSLNGQGKKSIIITNYEKLHYHSPDDYGGVVCDESSILKSFDGVRRTAITQFMKKIPYRLLCTATAAPNDYIELGTSSEALGELGYTDMITRFFTPSSKSGFFRRSLYGVGEYRFKGHAEQPFWRWVCSWARAVRKPSDLGYDDDGFVLKPLVENDIIIKARKPRPDMLFDVPAIGFHEEREVRRRTIHERCEAAADKTQHGEYTVIWCHLNDEGDYLSKIIPDSVQISGQDSDDSKEKKFESFRIGDTKILIIKPKIGAFGLNWQHCNHVVYFASHSYEQYYQAIRRCWRFGQENTVTVDMVRTDGEERIVENLKRKSEAASRMFSDLVSYMNESIKIDRNKKYDKEMEVPNWL